MPETAAPPIEGKPPRPVRRVLRIAGILSLSAILIGGSVLLWVLHQRRTAFEPDPIGVWQGYAMAQELYHRQDWNGDGKLTYARPFSLLFTQKDAKGRPLGLIDGALAGATNPQAPKHGYYFADMVTIAGRPIDWTKEFALCGTPAAYGLTGRRTYIVGADGIIWGKDFGKSQLVADFPADPAKEGWTRAE